MTTINERVIEDRKARGLSRAKYAELVGLTPTQVNNIEHGRELKEGEEAKLLAVLGNGGSDPAGVTEPAEQKPEAETHGTAQPAVPKENPHTWECGTCKRVFDDPVTLGEHMRSHDGDDGDEDIEVAYVDLDEDELDDVYADVYVSQQEDTPVVQETRVEM